MLKLVKFYAKISYSEIPNSKHFLKAIIPFII